MGAEPGALGRVQPALEQCAEDRGLDGRPVKPGQSSQGLDVVQFQGEYIQGVEEPTVEPLYRLETDQAALGHGAEQGLQHPRVFNRARTQDTLVQTLCENAETR